MWSSRRYSPPSQRVSGITRGRGLAKENVFKVKYGAKLEFPEGWGCKPEDIPWREGMDIFWNHTMGSKPLGFVFSLPFSISQRQRHALLPGSQLLISTLLTVDRKLMMRNWISCVVL